MAPEVKESNGLVKGCHNMSRHVVGRLLPSQQCTLQACFRGNELDPWICDMHLTMFVVDHAVKVVNLA